MISSWRTWFGTATAVIVGTATIAAGCGGSTPDSLGEQAGASGEQVYRDSCASCHGADLRGTPDGPSQLSIVYEPNHHGDDAYRSAIRNGAAQHHWSFGDMPAVEGISDDEVEAVIAYIRSQQQLLGFE